MPPKIKNSFSSFWTNPWTRTILPLVAVGGVSWGVIGEELDGISHKLDANGTAIGDNGDTIHAHTEDQIKDNIFRESDNHYNKDDALEDALKSRREFRVDVEVMADKLSKQLKESQKENVRIFERLEDKVDKINQ